MDGEHCIPVFMAITPVFPGNTYLMKTPDTANDHLFDYLWMVNPRSYLEFEVKACHDVHVLLAHRPWNSTYRTFEVIIGGWDNSKSVIRDSQVSCLHCPQL